MATPGLVRPLPEADLMPEELRAAIGLFASLLDERQRRLFAGLEALKCGWGGDRRIAQLLGIDPSTVAAGRRQLVERDIELDRVRRAGGGRPRTEKNAGSPRPPRSPDGPRDGRRPARRPEVDPPHDRQGRRRTGQARHRHLRADRRPASQADGFLVASQPQEACGHLTSEPRRPVPAHRRLRERCAVENTPVISVDTKKKELVGAFKNAGAKWDHAPVLVKDHDFRSEAEGLAIPYGVYDTQANTGTVYVGATADTPAFAVDCIEKWWRTEGRKRYPEANCLHVLADSGGSNGCKPRAWKFNLQHRLCNRHGLRVSVAHYPPATSKRNPIEHRLFCEISKNWAGRPLDSYETILNYLRSTRTATGLRVRAHLVRKAYETGVKVTNAQMNGLRLTRDSDLPKWNYTIEPM